jgi:hypothetical protein
VKPDRVEAAPGLQPYDRIGRRGEAALDDLNSMFGTEEVVAPSVPTFLVPRLAVVDRWCWATTSDHRLGALYIVDPRPASGAVAACLSHGPSDGVFACEHSGHGANSYLLSVAWRFGGAALFVQSAFDGVYMDRNTTRRVIEARHRIVSEHMARVRPAPDDGLFSVAVISDFADDGVVVLERAGGADPNDRGFRSLSRSDPARSDAGRWLSALVDAMPVEALPPRYLHGQSPAPKRPHNWELFLQDGSTSQASR